MGNLKSKQILAFTIIKGGLCVSKHRAGISFISSKKGCDIILLKRNQVLLKPNLKIPWGNPNSVRVQEDLVEKKRIRIWGRSVIKSWYELKDRLENLEGRPYLPFELLPIEASSKSQTCSIKMHSHDYKRLQWPPVCLCILQRGNFGAEIK